MSSKEKIKDNRNKDNIKKIKIKEKRNDIPKTTIISEGEEKKIRKKTKTISYFLIILIIFGIISSIIDYVRFKQNKLPVFAVSFSINDDEIKEYYGLGYKVINMNTSLESNNMRFGSWFKKVSEYEIKSFEYNKTKELNVVKLKILEDLSKITNNIEEIPSNPDKYIEENKDQYNQIKEIESGYQYFIELIIHSESASQFEKYILAKMINDKNEKIDFKFNTAKEFIEQYEVYLSEIDLKELENTDLDKIAYDIIFGNPEIN